MQTEPPIQRPGEESVCLCCESSRTRFVLEKNRCPLFECLDCGHVFVSSAKALCVSDIYSQPYFQSEDGSGVDFLEAGPQLRSVARGRLERISRYRDKAPGRFLEIGCAVGYLLQAARDAGWSVKGVELSHFASEYARQELGLEVLTGSLESVKQQLEPGFDVVAMYHVIEHLTDPIQTLRHIRSLVDAGALLVVECPDFSSRRARRLGSSWKYCIPPEHISYFCEGSLAKALALSGFDIVGVETTTLTEMLGFTKKLGLAATRKLIVRNLKYLIWVRRAYKRFRTCFKLDDVLTVYARAIPDDAH